MFWSFWRGINKAPHDGTPVLACEPGSGMAVVHWQANGWRDCHGSTMRPTHWMPLPPWPRAAQKGTTCEANVGAGVVPSKDDADNARGPAPAVSDDPKETT